MIRNAAAPHTLYNTLLGHSGAEALPTVDQTVGSSYATLDVVGVQIIAEQLATGRLPVEVALLYEVPILHFRRWMRDRISDDLLIEIRSAAAESLQVKALLTLSARLDNPAAASQAKALSERMARISEALSPKDWNPARVEAPDDVPSVTIIMRGLGVDTGRGKVIDHDSRLSSPEVHDATGGATTPSGPPLPNTDPWNTVSAVVRRMSEGLDGYD